MFSSFFQILQYHIYFFLFFQTRFWFQMSIYCEKVWLLPTTRKLCLKEVIFVGDFISASKIGCGFHKFQVILVITYWISLVCYLNRNLWRVFLRFINVCISPNQLCFLIFIFYEAFPALIFLLTPSIKSVLLIYSIWYRFVGAFTDLFRQVFVIIWRLLWQ